jgi:hypothetical protein
MNNVTAKPPGGSFWFSALGILAGFLVFGALLVFAYLPRRPTRVIDPGASLTPDKRQEAQLLTPEERATRLKDLRESEHKLASTYGWVDKNTGVVRLPLDRAVELTVEELAKGQGAKK